MTSTTTPTTPTPRNSDRPIPTVSRNSPLAGRSWLRSTAGALAAAAALALTTLICAAPASAVITITTPAAGTTGLTFPFTISGTFDVTNENAYPHLVGPNGPIYCANTDAPDPSSPAYGEPVAADSTPWPAGSWSCVIDGRTPASATGPRPWQNNYPTGGTFDDESAWPTNTPLQFWIFMEAQPPAPLTLSMAAVPSPTPSTTSPHPTATATSTPPPSTAASSTTTTAPSTAHPATTNPSSTTPAANPPSTTTTVTVDDPPTLAATGNHTTAQLLTAISLIALGTLITYTARTTRRRHRH